MNQLFKKELEWFYVYIVHDFIDMSDKKGIRFIFRIDFSLVVWFGVYSRSLAHGLIIYEIA